MLNVEVVLLGFFAGITILLGLPIARIRGFPVGARAFLGSLTAGILIFLLWDVLSKGLEPVGQAAFAGDLSSTALQGTLALGMFALSFLGLTYFERMYKVPVATVEPSRTEDAASPIAAKRSMNLIATGIGLHNFAEGLAIGAVYTAGGLGDATVLFVGFALHNSTEGFGIVGPALASGYVPSWKRLGALGLLGGGPTLFGTLVGAVATLPSVSVAFLGVAAGAILYVVIELVQQRGRPELAPLRSFGIFVGFAFGLITDLVVTAGHL